LQQLRVPGFTVLSEAPVANFANQPDRFHLRHRPVEDLTDGEIRLARAERDGHVNWGFSIWRHKLEVLRQAVADHGEIVWLDWDVVLTRPLPGDFWGTLSAGPSFRATLVQYRRHVCRWRKSDQGGYQPLAAWIYCRDPGLIDDALGWHDDNPTRSEQVALAWALDQRMPRDAAFSRRWRHDSLETPYFRCRESVIDAKNKPLFRFGWTKGG
jgi:hypothetical protein